MKSETSNGKRGIKYKPYGLKEYKLNFGYETPKPLGGMGPNVNTPVWKEKAILRDKMLKFGKEAEKSNKMRL